MAPRVDAYLRAARAAARDAHRLAQRLPVRRGDEVVAVHDYAWPGFEAFARRYVATSRARFAVLSMNPGRNGAVQTGIAFTDAPTARQLLPVFDGLAARPPAGLRTDRVEVSGQKLQAWARRRFGGLEGLYREAVFPIACPLAVLRGPRRLNVPLPALGGEARRAVDALYEAHAARLVRALRPAGVLLLGDYAERRWSRVRAADPALATLAHRRGFHPAAHVANAVKFRDWSAAWRSLSAARGSPTS